MTFGELDKFCSGMYFKGKEEFEELMTKEVKVSFDWPREGTNEKFDIVKIDDNGIVLYNPRANRPAGHGG